MTRKAPSDPYARLTPAAAKRLRAEAERYEIVNALEQTTARHRNVLRKNLTRLHDDDGASFRTIAKALGCSYEAVRLFLNG